MFMLGIGELLEEWTHKKSVDDLARTMSLNVGKVWLVSGGQEVLVSTSQIKAGDKVVVHMGNIIPFDGVVAEGEAMVNQASLTGESVPVRKTVESTAYAGTVVEEGELTILVKDYALSSGTSHSAQYALAAMLKAANEGQYNFLDEVKIYGERAHRLKEIFLRHGFHLVYDNDLGDPVADGFYFTIGYPGMTSGELAKELMYYGVSAISLITTGSHQEGLRACTSFIQDHQYAQLEERMAIFAENHPI